MSGASSVSGSGGIDLASVYNTPIGQILEDLNPETFVTLETQESQSQVTTYTNQENTDQSQISAWTTLQSDAQTFAADVTGMANSTTFSSLSATSSNSGVLAATDQSAQAGSYTISVGSLAEAEIDTGSSTNLAVTSPNTTLTSGGSTLTGSFSIGVGSQSAVTVTIPSSGETLNGLASLINSTANVGVTASVVQNSGGDWILEVQANQTGEPISYTDTSGTPLYDLGLVSSSGTTAQSAANVLQSASSASISFGSTYNAADAISSTSNTFTNAIPGMTLTAQSVGTTTITVSPDTNAMQTSIQKFVSDWNQWVSDTSNLADSGTVTSSGSGTSATYSYQSNSNQVLTSGLPQSVVNEVSETLGGAVNSSGGAYQSLADIGITFSSNGKLSVDSSTLSTALANDPSAVQGLFTTIAKNLQTTSTSTIISGFSLGSKSTTGEAIGELNQQVTQDQNSVSLLNQQVNTEETHAIDQYGQWVNQLATYSEQYSLYNALYNQNTSDSSEG